MYDKTFPIAFLHRPYSQQTQVQSAKGKAQCNSNSQISRIFLKLSRFDDIGNLNNFNRLTTDS